MLDNEKLEKIDSKKMFKVYDEWPEIARAHYEQNLNGINLGEISHVVFSGMGGSGAISDIFSAILSKTNIHVDIVKGYLLPKTVNSNSLVIITSVSGNTEEALSTLIAASKIKCKILAFSDGGKIQEFCNKNNLEHRKISKIHSPRASFPAFLFSIIKTLEPFLPIEKNDVSDALNQLEKQRELISSKNCTSENPAITLAEWISDIPLIYYPWGLQAAAIRFKNSLQENAKMHAITEDVIEACHNGIVSWEKKSNIKPILIRGNDDYIKTKERWEILKEFFSEKNIDFQEIYSVKGSILSKIINLIYLLDYSTIYKSVMLGINPTPVAPIDFIKNKLNS